MLRKKIIFGFVALTAICACDLRYRTYRDVLNKDILMESKDVENVPFRQANSIVVCRSKQCAPAKLSMSNQYIYNSLLRLFDNNTHQKALICQANPGSKTCLENYITLPIKVGAVPAYMYIDSVKITDTIINKGENTLKLILNYNVTYNGQTPDCTPAKSLVYVKNINHILLEDDGDNCKMTSMGGSNIKTVR